MPYLLCSHMGSCTYLSKNKVPDESECDMSYISGLGGLYQVLDRHPDRLYCMLDTLQATIIIRQHSVLYIRQMSGINH